MIDFLKRVLDVVLKVLPLVRTWRRAKKRKAFREAIATGDEAKMNKLWQDLMDK